MVKTKQNHQGPLNSTDGTHSVQLPVAMETIKDSNFTTPNIQLYSEEASYRDSLLRNVSYTMRLELGDTLEKGYKGSITIRFNLAEIPQTKAPLFLDF